MLAACNVFKGHSHSLFGEGVLQTFAHFILFLKFSYTFICFMCVLLFKQVLWHTCTCHRPSTQYNWFILSFCHMGPGDWTGLQALRPLPAEPSCWPILFVLKTILFNTLFDILSDKTSLYICTQALCQICVLHCVPLCSFMLTLKQSLSKNTQNFFIKSNLPFFNFIIYTLS